MDRINLNGRDYIAADVHSGKKIGIGITTHNRQVKLNSAIAQHMKHLPDNSVLVVVDDGTDVPITLQEDIHIIRNDSPQGIAKAKNQCLAYLAKSGCDEFFLFDDDCWPVAENWHNGYISSPEHHLMMLWGDDVYFRNSGIVGHRRPKGCMLYASSQALMAVGGMDPEFGRWGFEHENWSDRIHNAGLTSCRYADIESPGLFHADDKSATAKSSVPEADRQNSRPDLAEKHRHDSYYVDYFRNVKMFTNEKQPLLSVLIPSVDSRRNDFARKIQDEIYAQIDKLEDPESVEVIFLSDNRMMNLGGKRNKMVSLARGKYTVFVDDDDRLSPDYLSEILAAARWGNDVITFRADVSVNGQPPKPCTYSLQYSADSNTAGGYQRIPNHICAVKREIALRAPFPEKSCGEDAEYAVTIKPLLRSESHINKTLYFYDYSDTTTETQKKNQAIGEIIRQSKNPVADVIFLSRGDTPERRKMTNDAISSCISGAGSILVNCIVIEQAKGIRYKNAITIHPEGDFRYNAFSNMGARTGNADFIVFANNDLIFHKDWLRELIASNTQVASPRCPNNGRQNNVTNPAGFNNGVNFSGWCFMMHRSLWEKIGGLDEDFKYWCADDSVIEQVKAVGQTPMLVSKAVVTHLTSKTGAGTLPDDLTWGQVALFEKKYGVKKFEHDPRYAEYKKKAGLK